MKRIPTPYLFIAVILAICISALVVYKSASDAMNKVAVYRNTSLDATVQAQKAAQLGKQLDQGNATETALSAQINADNYVVRGLGHNIQVRFNDATHTYTFTDSIGKQLNNAAYRRVGKQAIFNIELSTWAGDFHPDTVTVNVLGPSGATLLMATLQKTTESLFNWNNLDPDSAWNAYDTTFISPSISNKQTP